MTQIPAGWYPDPAPQSLPGRLRYWDGAAWTEHVHDPQPAPEPPQPSPPAYPPAYPASYPQGSGATGTYQPAPYQPAPYQPGPYQQPGRVATTPDGVPLAGWWWRVLARVLDGFIALPLYLLASAPVVASQWDELDQWFDDLSYAAEHNTPDPPTPDLFDFTSGPGLTMVVSWLAVYVLYELVFLFWKQATPGKLIVGLRVRRREAPGLPAPSILGRVGFLLLGQFCGLLLLLDYLWPLWDDKKQALHDKVAGTNVVRPGHDVPGSQGPVQDSAQGTSSQTPTEEALPPRW